MVMSSPGTLLVLSGVSCSNVFITVAMKIRLAVKLGFYFSVVVLFLGSCTGEQQGGGQQATGEDSYVSLTFPSGSTVFELGQDVEVSLAFDSTKTFTSFELYVDSSRVHESARPEGSHVVKTGGLTVGTHTITCRVKSGDECVDIDNLSLILLSDVTPVKGSYEILGVIPHDTRAYTQGLIVEGGQMYEGTGMRGESTLRRVDMRSGEVLQEIGIPEEHFGEGVTIVNDKIIQLTWQSNIGFVYDKKTFRKLKEFGYPTEGWGLTFDGRNLLLSDGSEQLMFLDTATYRIIKRVQVYDNSGPISKINELEYVDGFVYANIYTTDFIVKIDPATGKVVERWDMPGLLGDADRDQRTDVLNGIAYDGGSKHFYITGKYWPKMFEMILK